MWCISNGTRASRAITYMAAARGVEIFETEATGFNWG